MAILSSIFGTVVTFGLSSKAFLKRIYIVFQVPCETLKYLKLSQNTDENECKIKKSCIQA